MSYDNTLTLKEKFLVFIFILGIIFIPYYVYKTIDKADKIKKEWNYKVNIYRCISWFYDRCKRKTLEECE